MQLSFNFYKKYTCIAAVAFQAMGKLSLNENQLESVKVLASLDETGLFGCFQLYKKQQYISFRQLFYIAIDQLCQVSAESVKQQNVTANSKTLSTMASK